VAGTAAAARPAGGCDDLRFSPAAWRAARAAPDPVARRGPSERLAAAIVRCRVVAAGDARASVRRLLGPPDRRPGRTWIYLGETVGDGLGPGDGQELRVRFGRAGRVERATLLYPEDG